MKSFSKDKFDDGLVLNENENIHASLVGIAVDYLTRFSLGDSVDKAFHISCLGASNIGMSDKAIILKATVRGLDDVSIISACKLAGFDVCYRSSKSAYKPIEDINPDVSTIENIRIMVNRCVSFWNKYGPIVCSELTFEGGYTDTVNVGDGDFLSKDTLWDLKVSKSAPTAKHSLQLLMYYVMGQHSVHEHFKSICNLGIFNPRLNTAYICPVSSISAETIAIIENDVLCYGISLPVNINTDEYSVADICRVIGLKKSVVYNDIRLGKLKAYKKGNKYCITQAESLRYIEQIRSQRKNAMITLIVGIVLLVLIMLYMFGKGFNFF